jgi:hypothetical protein
MYCEFLELVQLNEEELIGEKNQWFGLLVMVCRSFKDR